MKHSPHNEEMLELATLYAFGALPAEQAAAFEAHLGEGCLACQRELDAAAAIVGPLGYAAPPARPRPEVRNRLLSRIRAEAQPSPLELGWGIVRSTEGEWELGSMEGVTLKPLYCDRAGQRLTALVRMEGGVRYPPHQHADTEELYLLEGDLIVEGQVLRAGDYCAAIGGTTHGAVYSEAGCTFLVVASERDAIVEDGEREAPPERFRFVRATEGAWRGGGAEGVKIRPLFSDLARGTLTAVVHMRAGSRLPRHRHVTLEQSYMLEGDGHAAGQVLQAGDYYWVAADSVHDVAYTEGGCLFLLLASRVEVLG